MAAAANHTQANALELSASGQESISLDSGQSSLLENIDARFSALFSQLGLDQKGLAHLELDDDELDRRYWDERDRERQLGAYSC